MNELTQVYEELNKTNHALKGLNSLISTSDNSLTPDLYYLLAILAERYEQHTEKLLNLQTA